MNSAEMTPDVHLFVFHAFLLRLQSGTNARHSDLAGILWSDVSEIEGASECKYAVKLRQIKLLGSHPREFWCNDAITSALAGYWVSSHSPTVCSENSENIYLFPKVGVALALDFKHQMTYECHNNACKLCAGTIGLQVSPEFKDNLGCKAVKRGNAATVAAALQRYLT